MFLEYSASPQLGILIMERDDSLNHTFIHLHRSNDVSQKMAVGEMSIKYILLCIGDAICHFWYKMNGWRTTCLGLLGYQSLNNEEEIFSYIAYWNGGSIKIRYSCDPYLQSFVRWIRGIFISSPRPVIIAFSPGPRNGRKHVLQYQNSNYIVIAMFLLTPLSHLTRDKNTL